MRATQTIHQMLAVKRLADGKSALLSNQGQALDGHTELSTYRSILERHEREEGE